MTLGFVMLVHTAFDRAEQVARYWASHGCPVIIHVDGKVNIKAFRAFKERFRGERLVRLSKRVRVEWGTWSLVEATQLASTRLLENFPDVRHVYLVSGSCLPLRPAAELSAYLDANPETDFIESVTIDEVNWTIDGLEAERFTMYFPLSWRRNRKLFDRLTQVQRQLGIRRSVPNDVEPHLGSQWWCLTRRTLEAILQSPDRARMDAYFKRVWIPDESYFQSLARRYSTRIESRSLTLAKFDVHGRPHIFYDDHKELLERSDCFLARKIWPQANRLYETFLSDTPSVARRAEPNPGKIDRVFTKANERRGRGRLGLYSQARFPEPGRHNGQTSSPYNVFCGFDDLFLSFDTWLARRIGGRVHGHLFHPDRAEFAGGEEVLNGCLSDSAPLRDYRPQQFLTNLLWSTRGEQQTFFFGPRDVQDIVDFVIWDPNATITIVSGAWVVPLYLSDQPFDETRKQAAKLQRTELSFLKKLETPGVSARVHRWNLAEFLLSPVERMQGALDTITGSGPRRLTAVPDMRDMSGLQDYLSQLRNGGIKPVVMGDFAALPERAPPEQGRPRIVR